jgi:hypothetical protein
MRSRRHGAGGSAERHFRRWRRAWRRELRLPLLIAVTPLLLAALLLRLFLPWNPQFWCGFLLGSASTFFVAVWDTPPERIAKWRRGAEGERATAKALEPLHGDGWHVRHDLAARFGNIDHLAVGPGGVFLLDSKNLAGVARVTAQGVLSVEFARSPSDNYILPGLARGLDYRSREVRDRLRDELGWIVDVRPLVAINGHFSQRVVRVGRLTYAGVEALAEVLASEPRRIAPTDLAAVVRAVEALESAPDLPGIDQAESVAGRTQLDDPGSTRSAGAVR